MSEAPSVPSTAEVEPQRTDKPPVCKVYRAGKAVEGPTSFRDISELLKEEDALVWFDVVDPSTEDLALLEQEFNLHPLAIEDAVTAHERPKIEAYEGYYFVVIIGTTLEAGSRLNFHEMSIFASQKYLVTVRHTPAYPLEEIEHRWNAHPEGLRRGGGFLLYTILDTVVDGYFPVTELFEDEVEALEERLFDERRTEGNTMRDIFTMRKEGQSFRHAVLPMRDILNPIIRGDLKFFSSEEITYFRDVYDHAVRVIDQLDTIRDLLSSALDIHLSVIANRQNEVSKQLTLIATIFLPLSFVVGFFGQNFSFMVEHIRGAGSFWFLGIGTEVVAILLLGAYFRARGWWS